MPISKLFFPPVRISGVTRRREDAMIRTENAIERIVVGRTAIVIGKSATVIVTATEKSVIVIRMCATAIARNEILTVMTTNKRESSK